MKNENCYLCNGNTGILYYFPKGKTGIYHLLRCTECGFIRISPVPEQKIINNLYAKNGMSEKQMENEVFSSPFLTSIKKSLIIKPLINRLHKEFPKINSPTLLDIGCSTGWITSVSKETGFEVTGLEANPYVANYGRKKYGIEILEGFIEDLNTEKCYYAVTMFHVLEHLADPLKMLGQIYTLLNERGKLLAVVPNAGSLGVKIFRKNYNWNVPHHISFFSPETIDRILKDSGFRIFKIEHLISPPILLYSFNRFMRSRKKNGKLSFVIKNRVLGNAVFFPFSLTGKIINKGEVIAVFAEKVK